MNIYYQNVVVVVMETLEDVNTTRVVVCHSKKKNVKNHSTTNCVQT